MNDSATQIFGLFELDTAGTVMYSRLDAPPVRGGSTDSLIGRNFFDEIASSEYSAEIQRRFRYFAKNSEAAEKFTLSYSDDRSVVQVKVMLTQISRREYDEKGKSIILDIRKI